jgi:UDPglucose 6-dehydrogenase
MITVIGLGFVGLTTCVGLAYKGIEVYGYDIDKSKLESIKRGKSPFYEPGLDKVIASVLESKKFMPGDNLKNAVENSELIVFCVGTPYSQKGLDLNFLKDAVKSVLRFVKGYTVLVIKSTVPPSTTAGNVKKWIEEEGFNVGRDIGLANNPEFLREGNAWEDFIAPDRIVIGQHDKKSGDAVEKLYLSFNSRVFRTSLNTAEFIKFLSNTFLSTLISFSNELAAFGETIGDIEILSAFKFLHKDRRWIGSPASMVNYIYPGCGFGGYCLPKDTSAAIKKSEEFGFEMQILKAVLNVNEDRKKQIAVKIKKAVGGELRKKRVAILGLSFKPGTNDVRESPAKSIIEIILKEGGLIKAYDPKAMEDFKKFNLDIQYAGSFEEAIEDIDAIGILTGWEEFKRLKDISLKVPVVDGRFILGESKPVF